MSKNKVAITILERYNLDKLHYSTFNKQEFLDTFKGFIERERIFYS